MFFLYASLYSAGFGQKRNIDCCTLDRSSTIHVCSFFDNTRRSRWNIFLNFKTSCYFQIKVEMDNMCIVYTSIVILHWIFLVA